MEHLYHLDEISNLDFNIFPPINPLIQMFKIVFSSKRKLRL